MDKQMGKASIRRKRGKGRIAVLGVASAAVLAACGSSSSSTGTSGATTTSSASGAASGAASGTPYVRQA
ncbi:MAG: hypothetical protein M0Z96_02785, partial [Actinomycetota bacterium]|nr:hypothetical protein [Actinomycetota bacterium]